MRKFFAVLVSLIIGASLNAREVKHLNGVANVPENPKRIVSLSDWKITVTLLELGANVVGSVGHVNKVTNKPFIRGVSMLGKDFSNTDIEYLGGSKSPDLEKITALKPDLIIGLTRHVKIADQLSKVAPVVIIGLTGEWLDTYKMIADATNRVDTFNTYMQKYNEKIKYLKSLYKNSNDITVSVIRSSKDEFSSGRYNMIQRVLDDVGFKHPKGMEEVFKEEDGKDFTLEAIKLFDADYILDMYSPHKGENPLTKIESQAGKMVAKFTKAGKNNNYVPVDRNKLNALAFKSLDYVVEAIPYIVR